MKNDNLGVHIYGFLQSYLTLQKGLSQHTILSYRDTIKLFVNFSVNHNKRSVADLTLSDFEPTVVIQFLDYLEKERGNSRQTRNIRLACLHSLSCYLAKHEPLIFDNCQRILAIPFKRTSQNTVDYLEREEVKAIFEVIDRTTLDGCRDYTLLFFMYNTGARVQEVISLYTTALQLDRPFQVRFVGKGRKERLCPLWSKTVNLLRSLLKQREVDPKADVPVFVNHKGERLTRHGIRYLLKKYVLIASKDYPSLKGKNVHPHTIRHTTAMHLLQSGVDINTIRAWLGHVNLETTNRYAEINLDMKRKVLDNFLPIGKINKPWKQSQQLITWLESL